MFLNREDAAKALLRRLKAYKGRKNAVIVAIPRGGVVIGAALAKALHLPLDIILTKKIGHPLMPEYAIGVVDLSSQAIDEAVVERDHIRPEYVQGEIERIRALLKKRYAAYRGSRAPVPLKAKTVILVDDGIATGNTMAAAIGLLRLEQAKKIIAAVPVAPADAVEKLGRLADEVVCVLVPERFFAIGQFYETFEQVDDDEALRLLGNAGREKLKVEPSPSALSTQMRPP